MQSLEALIDPVELTAFVRELVDAEYQGPNSLEAFLPRQDRLLTEWAFNRADRDRPAMGQYRAFDAESGIIGRPGFERISGAIPPISMKTLLGEGDRTALEVAMRNGDRRSQYLRDLIFGDARRLTLSVLARVEWARATALRTGTVTFTAEEGIVTTITYNDASSTVLSAVAATLWSVSGSATPMANQRAWMQTYRASNNDDMPAVGLTSQRVIDAMMLTTEVKNLFAANGVVPGLLTQGQMDSAVAAFGLPPLRVFNGRVNIGGTVTRLIPDNEILYLPAGDVDGFGETTFGVSADALDLADQGSLPLDPVNGGDGAPGLVAKAWQIPEPVQRWTKVGGLVIPVLKDPKRIFRATVLS